MKYPENYTRELIDGLRLEQCFNAQARLRSLLVVGAQTYPEGCFKESDPRHIYRMLRLLHKNGHTVSSDLKISYVNINDCYGGEDYLDPDHRYPADIVLVAWISDKSRAHEHNEGLKGSRWHTSRGAWTRAAMRSGAKAIVTVSRELSPGADVEPQRFLQRPALLNRSPFFPKAQMQVEGTYLGSMNYNLMLHKDFKAQIPNPAKTLG